MLDRPEMAARGRDEGVVVPRHRIDGRVDGGVWEMLVKIWESGRKMAPCGPDLPRRALESRIRYQNYREREGFDEVKPRTSQEFRGPSRRGLAASTLATVAASSTSQAARCSTPIQRKIWKVDWMNRVEAESPNSLLEVLIISRSGASVIMYVYVCVFWYRHGWYRLRNKP
jgi:hypothetical protein